MKTVILTNQEPERLDVALAKTLGISRAKAQKAIKDGRIFVSGSPATAHSLVDNTSLVEASSEAFEETAPATGPLPKLEIIYEDADVIVVNKQAGILVHATETSTEPTLVDAILAHHPEIAAVGDDKRRFGIVHRLDKEASGILVVAKTPEAYLHLKNAFATRQTTKRYTVLVMGKMLDDVGTVTFPIARSRSRARMAARPLSQEGKEAITHYEIKQRYANATLLDVQIETGRTHQIRAHMFALGFPVAGDTLYVRRGIKQLPLGRLFLHARELTVPLPSGETKTFSAPLTPELEKALSGLHAV